MRTWTKLSILAACLILITPLSLQAWVQRFNAQRGYSIQAVDDGGYIATGKIYNGPEANYDLWLVKLDSLGDTVWTRSYGKKDYISDLGSQVRQTQDGGFIVTGSTGSFSTMSRDLWLLKTDSAGDTLWTRTYGGLFRDSGHGVLEKPEGGYVIVGMKDLDTEARVPYKLWIISIDPQGDVLWTREYGGELGETGNWIERTSDGGYIIAGYSNSFRVEQNASRELWLVKTDENGDTLWTRLYGAEEHSIDEGRCVRETTDGGFVITGSSNNCVWLLRTDQNGDTLWTRRYGRYYADRGCCVEEDADGGFSVAGWYMHPTRGDVDGWLLKTDANGDTLWTRLYGGEIWLSVPDDEYFYEFDRTADGGYVLVGSTATYVNVGGAWVIKTDSLGNTPLEVSFTKIHTPRWDEYDIYQMSPSARFSNLSTETSAEPIYLHCEIVDVESNDTVYHESKYYEGVLAPWGSSKTTFPEWTAANPSNFKITFSCTPDEGDSLVSRPLSRTFYWTSVEEDIHSPSRFEVTRSIGRDIQISYQNQPGGIRVIVYDASGRRVDELISEAPSGTINWGQGFRPGVYFISVQGANLVTPLKVILLE